MEKTTGPGGSNMEPSAPLQASLPTGPPSYEEAIAYSGGLANPPYPVGVSSMPVPPTCTLYCIIFRPVDID